MKVYDANGLEKVNTVGTDDAAIHDNVAAEISAITEKASPVSGDLLIIEDSAAGNVKKRVQVGNLPAPPAAVTFLSWNKFGVD